MADHAVVRQIDLASALGDNQQRLATISPREPTMSNQFGYNQSPQFPPPKPSGSGVPTVLIVVLVLVLLVPVAICGILLGAALLLPAVQGGREAARIAASNNNLKQIGVALHMYHDEYRTLPPAFLPDENGQPRTSWRTALLPYLQQGPLYNQYDTSAAWNDPRNAAVVNVPLRFYQSPRDESRLANRTSYVVIRGPDTVFPGSQPHDFASMKRGMGNTIMVVEIRNSDIAWAEPRDLDIDTLSTDPNAPNSINLNAGVVVVLGDGSVHTLKNITLEEFKALLLRGGTATMP
jgi:hypothetical protein